MNYKLKSFFEFRLPFISYCILFCAIFALFLSEQHFQALSTNSSQIGSLILFFGFGIRVLATITPKYMGKIKITGIYAICRQPLLLAQFISLIGLNIIVSNVYFFFISTIVFIFNDFLSLKKYDKILAFKYKDIWKIYAKHTNFVIPISNRIRDIFSSSISRSEFLDNQNTLIFIMIYAILVEIATFSNL